MVSPSRTPSSTSKYSSPAIPVRTGRKVATPFRTMKTPVASFFLKRSRRVSTGGAPSVSLGMASWFRTVSAMIGTLSACWRVSVMIRAVQLRSGRMSAGGFRIVTSTSKSTARSVDPEAVSVGVSLALWLILVTRPQKVVSR
jgi:hypothetical protein